MSLKNSHFLKPTQESFQGILQNTATDNFLQEVKLQGKQVIASYHSYISLVSRNKEQDFERITLRFDDGLSVATVNLI